MLSAVRIRNFRSIAGSDVKLDRLTVLIGANASGKTNFVDALGLIADSLTDELETAVLRRGGREALVWSGAEQPSFTISIDYRPVPKRAATTYEVDIAFDEDERPVVRREELLMKSSQEGPGRRRRALEVRDGRGVVFDETIGDRRQITGDAHILQVASLGVFEDQPQVKAMRDFIEGWKFLRVDVDAIRQPQTFQRTEGLATSAGNLAVVLNTMLIHRPDALASVNDALSAVIPGAPHVRPEVVGGKVVLSFSMPSFGSRTFPATSVSDGTLRLLAYLTALEIEPQPTLLCIEEPEHGLHPEAVVALVETLASSAEERKIQALLTTHSGDVLDALPSPAALRVVEKQEDGSTRIGQIEQIDDVGRWLEEFRLSELWRHHAIGATP